MPLSRPVNRLTGLLSLRSAKREAIVDIEVCSSSGKWALSTLFLIGTKSSRSTLEQSSQQINQSLDTSDSK